MARQKWNSMTASIPFIALVRSYRCAFRMTFQTGSATTKNSTKAIRG